MSKTMDLIFDSILSSNAPSVVNYMILQALEMGASDVHIEPFEYNTRTRMRVDGSLHHIVEYPVNLHDSIVARIKIMSGLKTDEKRLPQDGVISTTIENGGNVDLRVSTLPTIHGEKICMRIQDKTKVIPTFQEMGIRGGGIERLEGGLSRPNGIILVTGPTGSGKTTTLYSALRGLNKPGVNIMTIEDPVEYQMEGLNQCQIKHDIGLDFATGLRTALRQDPDIIMVGEIRDKETIEIALRAAMTGHLVLSTIHTNSAISTINRILDMGVKPFLIAASLKTIQAQRLVRKVCPNCATKYSPDKKTFNDIVKNLQGIPVSEGIDVSNIKSLVLTKGAGCDKCNSTGYKGRMGIYEVLEINREIEEMIVREASGQEIMSEARKYGYITMLQDGIIKALAGLTTIEEVFDNANEE